MALETNVIAPISPYKLLGKKIGANMNVTTDQVIQIGSSNYIVRKIIVTNASANLTLAVGGIYPAASKAGTALVANTQVFSALSGATKFVDLTLAAGVGTDRNTTTSLYLSLTVAQGSAATADVYIFGEDLVGLT